MSAAGVTWPILPSFDYSYGFPLSAEALDAVERVGDEWRDELLGVLESATFEALTLYDIEAL